MTSAMAEQTAQEPTMEEILASIRRIISEDDAPAKPAAETASAPAATPIKADSEDVLELTERAEPSPFAAEPAAVEPEPAAAAPKRGRKTASPFARFEKGGDDEEPQYDDSRFDAGGMFDAKSDLAFIAPDQPEAAAPPPPAPAPEPRPVAQAPAPQPQPQPQPQPVPTTMRDSDDGLLSKPAAASVASAFGALSRNVPMPPAGRSLEDLVKEMMKPMLADWLDQNLAQIVETKVQAEVERLSRQI
jgi:cell pole-organizing protein PopZ